MLDAIVYIIIGVGVFASGVAFGRKGERDARASERIARNSR